MNICGCSSRARPRSRCAGSCSTGITRGRVAPTPALELIEGWSVSDGRQCGIAAEASEVASVSREPWQASYKGPQDATGSFQYRNRVQCFDLCEDLRSHLERELELLQKRCRGTRETTSWREPLGTLFCRSSCGVVHVCKTVVK